MKVTLHPMFEGASGGLGQLVYRRVRGKVVVARKPAVTAPPTEEQIEHRNRFKMAVDYGKGAMSGEDMRDLYTAAAKQRDLPVYAVMIADYFNAPTIHSLDLDGYTGAAGGVLDIIVTDDFAVASVTVRILDEGGNLVESGPAAQASDGPNRWNYSATATITSDVTIEVTARDFPGGVSVKQFPFAKPS